jgi:hypothetical protein
VAAFAEPAGFAEGAVAGAGCCPSAVTLPKKRKETRTDKKKAKPNA